MRQMYVMILRWLKEKLLRLAWNLTITNQNSSVQIKLVLLFCTWHLTFVALLSPNTATLLGSPIGSSIDEALLDKVEALRKMKSRLSLLSSQDALIFLCHFFAIPKFLYILRTTPCFSSPCLAIYYAEMRSTLMSEALNINFSCESAWSQATLPVCFGGIGVFRTSQLAPSWPQLLVPTTSSTKFCLLGFLVFHT